MIQILLKFIFKWKKKFSNFSFVNRNNIAQIDENCKFCVGDYNGDGNPDLFNIVENNNGSKYTEFHTLSGKSNF